MRSRPCTSTLVIGAALVTLILVNSMLSASGTDLSKGDSRDERQNFFAALRLAFPNVGGAVRMNYSTDCDDARRNGIPFPPVAVRQPLTENKGLRGVREIFRDDQTIQATQDQSGLISITVGQPATEILKTKINVLTFTRSEQYTPELAVFAVIKTKEFKIAERKLKLAEPTIVSAITIMPPLKGLPHLPASLKDVTVDEAFDRIAKKFKGAVIYATCAQPAKPCFFTVDYQSLSNPGNRPVLRAK